MTPPPDLNDNNLRLGQAVRGLNVALVQDILFAIPAKHRNVVINQKDNQGYTPLMYLDFDYEQSLEILKILLIYGADIDFDADNIKKGLRFHRPVQKIILTHLRAETMGRYEEKYASIPIALKTVSENPTSTANVRLYSLMQILFKIDDPDLTTNFAGAILAVLRFLLVRDPDEAGFSSGLCFNDYIIRFISSNLGDQIISELLSCNLNRNCSELEDADSYQMAYLSSLRLLKQLKPEALKALKAALIKKKDLYFNNPDYREQYVSLLCHLNMTDEVREILNNDKKNLLYCITEAYCTLEDNVGNKSGTSSVYRFNDSLSCTYFLSALYSFEEWERLSENIEVIRDFFKFESTDDEFIKVFISLLTKMQEPLLLEKHQKIPGDIIQKIYEQLYGLFVHLDNPGEKPTKNKKLIKDKLASTILSLQLNKNLAPIPGVDAYILLDPDLLHPFIANDNLASMLASRLIALSNDANYASILGASMLEKFRENIFSNTLKFNPKLFFELLTDDKTDHTKQCQFIMNNFDTVLKKYDRGDDLLYMHMQAYLSKNKETIPYKQIIPYVKNAAMLDKIISYNLVKGPNKDALTVPRNNRDTNPILIAADQQNIPLFLHMYNNRDKEPWSIYWRQAGESENCLIKFLLIMPLPESNVSQGLVKEMLHYATSIKSVVAELHGKHLAELRTNRDVGNNIEKNIHSNLATLRQIIYPNIAVTNGIKKWWKRYIDTQEILNNYAKKRMQLAAPPSSDNAHDERIMHNAANIHNKDFPKLLAKRYPECANKTEQISKAWIDARLLLLKTFIECKPTDEKDIAIWEYIVNMCGMMEYYLHYSNQKSQDKILDAADLESISFVKFKKIAEKNNNLMNKVIDPIKGSDSELSLYFDTLKDVNSAYVKRCSFAWNAYAPVVRRSNRIVSYQYALQTDLDAREFSLFTMLLATEDVTTAIDSIAKDDYKALYSFVANDLIEDLEYLAIRNLLQQKISNSPIDADMPWDAIKKIVLKHALLEQSSLCSSFQPSAYNAIREASCRAGVFVIFSTAILANHRKYYHSSLDQRASAIQNIMSDKFKHALEKEIINILSKRLRHKQASFSFLSGYKSQKTNNPELDKFVRNFFESPPKTLLEMFGKINEVTEHGTKVAIVDLLFPSLAGLDIKNPNHIIEHDKELAALFDALFSVTTNNFSELFSGSHSIARYTSHLKEHITVEDTISLDEFDKKTGRADFLRNCFFSITIKDEIFAKLKQKDKMAKPISKYEASIIKYYSVAIAEAATMDGIASTFSGYLMEIYKCKTQQENAAIENIARPTNVSECDRKIKTFIALLASPAPEESVAKMRYTQQLKDILYQAVAAEYSLPLTKENSEFELNVDQFDMELENEHGLELMMACKTMAKYLVDVKNISIKNSFTGFKTIADLALEVAHRANETHNDDVYKACVTISKALGLNSFINNKSWHDWEKEWNQKMARKKADYDLL